MLRLKIQQPDVYATAAATYPVVAAPAYSTAVEVLMRVADERTSHGIARCVVATVQAMSQCVDDFWDAMRCIADELLGDGEGGSDGDASSVTSFDGQSDGGSHRSDSEQCRRQVLHPRRPDGVRASGSSAADEDMPWHKQLPPQELLISTDSLIMLFQFLLCRAQVPSLLARLAFVDDFLSGDLADALPGHHVMALKAAAEHLASCIEARTKEDEWGAGVGD